jgi:glycosyltransferase involved in cell wall biosynthesis
MTSPEHPKGFEFGERPSESLSARAEPFFSILVPTKNRAEIVGGAIQSVLEQSEPDFEVVVSDNDDSPDATRDAVSGFSDERIRYVRTSGNLAMHENWDNALLHATGKFVLVLEDKMRLAPKALSHLKQALKSGTQAVSYPILFVTTTHWTGSSQPLSVHKLSTRSIIDQLVRFDSRAFDVFPKGLDCCVERNLLLQIKASSPTGFVYSYICPDYAFGFLLLSHLSEIQRLNEPLAYLPNNWGWSGSYSNGQSSYRKDAKIQQFLKQLPVASHEITDLVPIKSQFLWINLVLYDFFTKYRRDDHKPVVYWPAYHAFVFLLILIGRRYGADMKLERREWLQSIRREGVVFAFQVVIEWIKQCMIQISRSLNSFRQKRQC